MPTTNDNAVDQDFAEWLSVAGDFDDLDIYLNAVWLTRGLTESEIARLTAAHRTAWPETAAPE